MFRGLISCLEDETLISAMAMRLGDDLDDFLEAEAEEAVSLASLFFGAAFFVERVFFFPFLEEVAIKEMKNLRERYDSGRAMSMVTTVGFDKRTKRQIMRRRNVQIVIDVFRRNQNQFESTFLSNSFQARLEGGERVQS